MPVYLAYITAVVTWALSATTRGAIVLQLYVLLLYLLEEELHLPIDVANVDASLAAPFEGRLLLHGGYFFLRT
jgi:hypothetical protein